jgi:hypothetical protein
MIRADDRTAWEPSANLLTPSDMELAKHHIRVVDPGLTPQAQHLAAICLAKNAQAWTSALIRELIRQ